MKRYLPIAGALVLMSATSLFAQAIPIKVSTPSPTPSANEEATQTVTGRITHLDTKTGSFTVRAVGSRKSVQLKAGNDVDIMQLRRGERVVVTYSGGTALKVHATRSTK